MFFNKLNIINIIVFLFAFINFGFCNNTKYYDNKDNSIYKNFDSINKEKIKNYLVKHNISFKNVDDLKYIFDQLFILDFVISPEIEKNFYNYLKKYLFTEYYCKILVIEKKLIDIEKFNIIYKEEELDKNIKILSKFEGWINLENINEIYNFNIHNISNNNKFYNEKEDKIYVLYVYKSRFNCKIKK